MAKPPRLKVAKSLSRESIQDPTSFGTSHHSPELNENMIGCHYDLTFERENAPTTDPHIVIGGKGGT